MSLWRCAALTRALSKGDEEAPSWPREREKERCAFPPLPLGEGWGEGAP